MGEYEAEGIALALQSEPSIKQVLHAPHRVLARHGALDGGVHRQRRRARPMGWYLPDLTRGQAELDSFDFIEDLKIAQGPLVSVLTATSLHGAQPTLQAAGALATRGAAHLGAVRQRYDLPVGAHRVSDTVGRIGRLCLALQVIPVFAPPREPGFQNVIAGLNALWQSKVWRHHQRPDVESLVARLRAVYRRLPRQDRLAARERPKSPSVSQTLRTQP